MADLEAGRPDRAAGSRYLPTLDGWRAVAISIVLLAHAPTLHFGPLSTAQFHSRGELGVQIFFAISGLLICGRLLDEEARLGSLRLGAFYTRRLFRIQPAALFYLAFIAVLTFLHRLPYSFGGLLTALLLVRNYDQRLEPNTWVTGHFWSLSVEEHFYLLLPSFLVLVRKWRVRLLLVFAALSYGWREYEAHRPGANTFLAGIRTEDCLCMLLLPAALAVLLKREWFQRVASRYLRQWVVFPVALAMLPDRSPVHALLLLSPALLLISTMLHPRSLLSRFLESSPLRFIGRISYSLYLWQQLFLSDYFAPNVRPFGGLNRSLLAWPCVFAAAIASYLLIEKPLIRLGHRLSHSRGPVRTPQSVGEPAGLGSHEKIPSTTAASAGQMQQSAP